MAARQKALESELAVQREKAAMEQEKKLLAMREEAEKRIQVERSKACLPEAAGASIMRVSSHDFVTNWMKSDRPSSAWAVRSTALRACACR